SLEVQLHPGAQSERASAVHPRAHHHSTAAAGGDVVDLLLEAGGGRGEGVELIELPRRTERHGRDLSGRWERGWGRAPLGWCGWRAPGAPGEERTPLSSRPHRPRCTRR